MYTLPRVYLSSSTTQHKQCKTLQDALDITHEITKLLSLRSIEKFASFWERVKDMRRALDIAEPERCLRGRNSQGLKRFATGAAEDKSSSTLEGYYQRICFEELDFILREETTSQQWLWSQLGNVRYGQTSLPTWVMK